MLRVLSYHSRAGAVLLALAVLAPLAASPPRAGAAVWVAPSQLRIEQALAELNYLPLRFVPTAPVASTGPQVQAGRFVWRWVAPAALRATWRAGRANPIETGAVMTFERVHALAITSAPTTAMEHQLLADLADHRLAPLSYNDVYVSTTTPERVWLFVNGRSVFTSLANTGVAASPTAPGTYPVYLRYVSQTMSGTYPWGGTYSDPGIPWVSYFHGGDALHGFVRAGYGWPQSLGCVETPPANARVLWPHTPIGTLVTVAVARP